MEERERNAGEGKSFGTGMETVSSQRDRKQTFNRQMVYAGSLGGCLLKIFSKLKFQRRCCSEFGKLELDDNEVESG